VPGLRDITILDADDVARHAPYLDLVDWMRAAHRMAPAEVARILFGPPGSSDNFMALPAWQPGDSIGVKLATIFPANTGRGIPSVQAVVLLFDGVDGTPLALLDGTELTYRKTAADSALGSQLLSRPDSATLLMVGAGGLAEHLVAAHRAVRPSIERVLVWNRTADKAAALVHRGIADEAVDDLDAAVAAADIICTATMTRDPLVAGALMKPGAHVDCVGAFLPDHREVDDDVVRRASIFVDARLATMHEDGDLVIPLSTGVIEPADVLADLYELCSEVHPGRTGDDEITMFENGGGGHLDLMTAQLVWQGARSTLHRHG
jgi:ornithine cyclodeaminase/alanine dehydrogenase-like protein (mu-crystallin family)